MLGFDRAAAKLRAYLRPVGSAAREKACWRWWQIPSRFARTERARDEGRERKLPMVDSIRHSTSDRANTGAPFPRLTENSPCAAPEARWAIPDLPGTELTALQLRPPGRWEANLNHNNHSKKENYKKNYTMHRVRAGRTVRVGAGVGNHDHYYNQFTGNASRRAGRKLLIQR